LAAGELADARRHPWKGLRLPRLAAGELAQYFGQDDREIERLVPGVGCIAADDGAEGAVGAEEVAGAGVGKDRELRAEGRLPGRQVGELVVALAIARAEVSVRLHP